MTNPFESLRKLVIRAAMNVTQASLAYGFSALLLAACALAMLLLTGCGPRLRGPNTDRITDSGSISEKYEAAKTPAHKAAVVEAQILGELTVARYISFVGIFLSIVAGVLLRAWVPGLVIIAGSCLVGCVAILAASVLLAFTIPYLKWAALGVLLLCGAWGIYRVWKFEKTP